jgi:spoIIIJ-associated protein
LSKFPKKNNSTEKTAKSVNDAVAAALEELGVSKDEVTIEVIDEGSKGFLGIGARDAVVRVTVNDTADDASDTEIKVASSPKKKSDASPSEAASKFLGDIFNAMNLDVNIDAKEGEDNTISIDLSGDNMGIVIGKRGDTLDSLQYLTSLVVNQNSDDYIKVSIDTENYREKRAEALLALAKRLSEKVARSGKKFTLEPMNPYERRIIHSSLQDNEDVTTYSVGSEPYRKVVIAPKTPKPSYKKKNNYKRHNSKPQHEHNDIPDEEITSENVGSYTTTYKADFKPAQHKAEYKNFDDYLAAHNLDH